MSPETVNGLVSGPPTDVFALGVVLYEMASGRQPFEAQTPAAVVARILSNQPAPLWRVNPAIPKAFDELVQQMLRKAPELRPSMPDVDRVLSVSQMGADAAPVLPARRTTVGREAERETLLRAYGRVKDGRSLIVALTGE